MWINQKHQYKKYSDFCNLNVDEMDMHNTKANNAIKKRNKGLYHRFKTWVCVTES